MKSFETYDGLRIAYQDEGEGLPLLCLAGLTRDSRDFDYVVPHLPNIRIIRPDYRGRGASEWASDSRQYTKTNESLDAIALLDHLGLEKAAVLGTSRGGLIAFILALSHPERLLGVCINDIGPEISLPGLARIADYLGREIGFNTRADMVAAMAKGMPGFANVPLTRWEEEVARHTTETADGLGLTYDPKLRDAVLGSHARPTPDLWARFDAFAGLPLALIRGENSDILSAETAKEMCRRRPDMHFANVPDRGHIPFLDEPEALVALRNWLRDCH